MRAQRLLFRAACACIVWSGASGVARADSVRLHWSTYLRDGPYENAHVIDEITRGSVIALGACNVHWCRVGVEGATGYIDKDAIALASPPDGAGKIGGPQGCFWDKQYSFRTPDETEFCSLHQSS